MTDLFGDLSYLFRKKDLILTESLVFRLHYRLTFMLIFASSILVLYNQYFHRPIICVSKDSNITEELLENYCWMHPTLSTRDDWYKGTEQLGASSSSKNLIVHYQWVGFILLFQALLFCVPHLIWKSFENGQMSAMSMHLLNPLDNIRDSSRYMRLINYLRENIRGYSSPYAFVYMFAVFLNFINVLGQFFLTISFLEQEKYEVYEVTSQQKSYSAPPYESGVIMFPKITLCTLYLNSPSGDRQRFDATCLLPINELNEKIYVGYWVWFLILSILTALELCYLVIIMISPRLRFYAICKNCRKEKLHCLKIVMAHSDFNDFSILSRLAKNVPPNHFSAIIEDLADSMDYRKRVSEEDSFV